MARSLRLRRGVPSRTFASMRVETLDKIPGKATTAVAGDAAAATAIKNFIAAMESDDCLLQLQAPLEGPSAQVAEGGGFYIGEMTLAFRDEEHGKQRQLYFLLVERLIELLREAGSAETLAATLCLTSGKRERPGRDGVVLWVRLSAKGDSPEQAALRWGLGLTHLQQALLFTSRHLRMQMSQRT
ncbi:MAG TPA: hypothetical protein VJN42_01645 [Candidatus Acidoferrum sp.]|nr:hypothetical protein [Candidatus Acidoferrum sp.]